MKPFIGLIITVFLISSCDETKKNQPEKTNSAERIPGLGKDSIGIFKWETELCQNESTFNARLYTNEELSGTYQLWRMVGVSLLETNGIAFSPSQIEDLGSLKELDLEYQKKKKQLQDLKVVNEPYWKKVKKSLMQELKDEYDLTRIDIQAYTNPGVLKGNRFSRICPELVTALTGNDTSLLFSTWETLAKEQSRHNASPEYIMTKFKEEYNNPDRLMFARVELITFGWHNQVNETLHNIQSDENINRKFEQLFLKTRSECDEP